MSSLSSFTKLTSFVLLLALQFFDTCHCSGQFEISATLAKSWIAGEWNENLSFEEIDELAGYLSHDKKTPFICLIPRFDRAEHQTRDLLTDLVSADEDGDRVSSKLLDIKRFQAKIRHSIADATDADVRVLRGSLISVITNQTSSPELRLSCAVALRYPDSIPALFLPAIVEANELSLDVVRSQKRIDIRTDTRLIDPICEVFDKDVDARQLASLLKLRVAFAQLKTLDLWDNPKEVGNCMAEMNKASVRPMYPYFLPEVENDREITIALQDLNSLGINLIGPVKVSVSTTVLYDSFRSGECVSQSRSTYSYFMRELLSDILFFGEKKIDILKANEESFLKIVGLCVYTDDLELAARSVVHYSDFQRLISSNFPEDPAPTLDKGVLERASLLLSERKFLFSQPMLDYFEIFEQNRGSAERLFK
ncbi:hypothetical protein [Stieleria varia]|uniref:Uncharacterized protein n=1 Tax=Stieleria varia TaxID=2528005 RepID=A0A5C6ATB3_9BACT|nr:hypothetical protein [Stieleria varia]TWU02960.1 hypothetical protein Pla52n_40490 [Stieleria varia]